MFFSKISSVKIPPTTKLKILGGRGVGRCVLGGSEVPSCCEFCIEVHNIRDLRSINTVY